eukprot:6611450-Alexandrium_andersonii.AAC.1
MEHPRVSRKLQGQQSERQRVFTTARYHHRAHALCTHALLARQACEGQGRTMRNHIHTQTCMHTVLRHVCVCCARARHAHAPRIV